VRGGVKAKFSYPLLPYLSKKVVSPPPHLKILATPLGGTIGSLIKHLKSVYGIKPPQESIEKR
jgi:hypothetical protein